MERDDKNLPSFLKEMKNESPFMVPEGYFEALSQSIMDEVASEKLVPGHTATAMRSIQSTWMKVLKYAAILVAFSGVTLFLWKNPQIESISTDWAEGVTNDEIQSYVLENLDQFEVVDFYDQDLDLDIDLLEGSFKEDELEEMLPEMLDDIDIETLENML